MNVRCRPYTEDDCDQVCLLLAELGYPQGPEILKQTASAILENMNLILVAEHQGEVVGCICAIVEARLAEGLRGEIVSLVVADGCRGLGVGRTLVARAEKWMLARTEKVCIRANVIRKEAHAFYERIGYRVVKEQKVFVKSRG